MTMTKHIECAKRVIQMEADALSTMASTLDEKFSQAVTTLSKASGRVIVSGMGKNGHIGNKLSLIHI